MQQLAAPGEQKLDYFLCHKCKSATQTVNDGTQRTIFHGSMEDGRLYTICLGCGDRQRAPSNRAYQSFIKRPPPIMMTPSEIVQDPTLEVALLACQFASCPSNQPGSDIVNRVIISSVSDDSLQRRFTCATCKNQWT